MQYLGTPYVWGGASPGGFDCSGFVQYVYTRSASRFRITRPRSTATARPCRSALQAGDLVFFDGLGHVGIYIGGGQFVHAPHTGDVVKISAMDGWYVELVRRRPSPLAPLASRIVPRRRVELLDGVSEVLDHDAALQLQRRRHLVLLHREVTREDREALDLLEP